MQSNSSTMGGKGVAKSKHLHWGCGKDCNTLFIETVMEFLAKTTYVNITQLWGTFVWCSDDDCSVPFSIAWLRIHLLPTISPMVENATRNAIVRKVSLVLGGYPPQMPENLELPYFDSGSDTFLWCISAGCDLTVVKTMIVIPYRLEGITQWCRQPSAATFSSKTWSRSTTDNDGYTQDNKRDDSTNNTNDRDY